MFDEINPTKSAVIINGKVGLTGGPDLIKRVDTEGYTFLKSEYGIDITKKEEKAPNMLGECLSLMRLRISNDWIKRLL